MSREIKFRAWNNANNEWLNKEDAECLTIYLDGRYEIDMGWVKVFPDLIIEQYTGLKDKNGKEIYEGDILQIDDHILGDFVVVWHNFGWKIKRSVGYESLSVHKSEDCTVIGNIHENPELLEDK